MSDNPVVQQTAASGTGWWRSPALWVAVWLVYALVALGYLAYADARQGIFLCVSGG